jgi:hypothetical protein
MLREHSTVDRSSRSAVIAHRRSPSPMSDREGHRYLGIHVSSGAKALLGNENNTYNISKLLVEKEVKYYEELIRCRSRSRKPAQPPTVRNGCTLQFIPTPTRTHLPPQHPGRHPTKNLTMGRWRTYAMPLLVERHGRHRKVDDCTHSRARLL